jgi:hypothetical protein
MNHFWFTRHRRIGGTYFTFNVSNFDASDAHIDNLYLFSYAQAKKMEIEMSYDSKDV